jgi:carbon storage regulator CsrA
LDEEENANGGIMLTLTRRAGDSIIIDGGITITVSSIQVFGTFKPIVRLGIDAPKETNIVRAEIADQFYRRKNHAIHTEE